MTQLSALNVKITGDTADLQSDLAKAETGIKRVGAAATDAQGRAKNFTGGMTKLGNVSGQTRAQIQNTSFQLQDIAVQLQGGTKASTVFAQQLPQLLGGFGALGAVLGVVAGVGIPALAFAFQALGDTSLTLEDALDELKVSLENYSEASKNASMTTQELEDKFGAGAAGLRSTYQLLEDIAASEAQRAIDGVAQSISDLLGTAGAGDARTELAKFFDVPLMYAFRDATREVRDQARILTSEFKQQQIVLGQSKGDLDAQIEATTKLISSAQGLAELKDGISEEEEAFIKQLVEALAVMQKQKAAMEGVSAAVRSTASEIEQMAKHERMLGEQMAVTGNQLRANVAIAKMLRDGISASAIDALILADVNMVDGVDAAAVAAAELAAKLSISLQEAMKIKALGEDPLDAFGGAGRFIPEQSPSWEQQGIDAANKGTVNSAGEQQDPLKGELERLQESLMSQEELELASYNRRKEVLREALEAKYLDEVAFKALTEEEAARHNEAMEQLDRQRQQVALQGFSGMFGDLASLMQSSNDKLFKIGKAAAIAEAVVNGYSAAVAAWDKGMKIGGPPVAAAFTGASLAKTGALISSINSTSKNGGGGGASGAVGGASGTSGAAAQAPAQTSNNVAISLTGGDMFSRDQVIQLINGINDAVDDGAQIRLV